MEEYLQYIGVTVGPSPDVSLIQRVIDAHNRCFFYCNQHLLLSGAHLSVEERSLCVPLVAQAWADCKPYRSGFCFQLNEMMFGALRRFFGDENVSLHAAIVVNTDVGNVASMEEELARRPHAHDAILVRVGSVAHVVDVGFGPNSLMAPLLFDVEDEVPLKCGDDVYRFSSPLSMPGYRQLELLLPSGSSGGGWTALYRLRRVPCPSPDQLVRELYLSPAVIPIRDKYIYVAKVWFGGRKWVWVVLGGTKVWKHYEGGKLIASRDIRGWEDCQALLSQEFDGFQLDPRMKFLFA